MKKILMSLAVMLLLAGCVVVKVPSYELDKAENKCSVNGGVFTIIADPLDCNEAICKNGTRVNISAHSVCKNSN